MKEILSACRETEQYAWIRQALQRKQTAMLSGVTTTIKAAWAAALFEDSRQTMLIITSGEEEASRLYENIQPFLGEKAVLFPVLELLPFEVYGHNIELTAARIHVLSRLSRGESLVVIASINAISRRLAPPGLFADCHLRLRKGDTWQLSELASVLSDMGYERQPLTEIPGSFSQRGSLVDVFPIDGEKPIRLEFFDDELESLRLFDPADQLSLGNLDSLFLPPGRELPVDAEARQRALACLQRETAKVLPALHGEDKKQLLSFTGQLTEYLEQGLWDNGLELLLSFFYEDAASLLEYVGEGIILLDEPEQVQTEAEQQKEERHNRYSDLLQSGRLLPSFYDNFQTFPQLVAELHHFPLLLLGRLNIGIAGVTPLVKQELMVRELSSYAATPGVFAEDMRRFRQCGFRTLVSVSSELRRKRVEELLRENELPPVQLIEAGFTKGFESAALKLVLITEKDLFAREGKSKSRRVYKGGEKIANFLDLRVGDYVVHINQGIGQYKGVERLVIGDIGRDYLLIRYAGEDKLYLPVDQLDLIQKYVGSDGAPPKIYKLGGDQWQRAKSKARASVRDMAQELLTLYAQREQSTGHAFSADSVWQQEFEEDFPYEETPDQLQSLAEIKLDMESDKVMDRLLCGDVGYGKTEVALRAAFKAVMDGKQVAVLAPTTVLAQQHLRTIEERFADYPVKAACLSRFAGAKEQKQMLAGLEAGEIDIIVGTHRLLSKDVRFKDLGLLIVDEEQRFGVTHKERIKAMKASIDVLTLSATPIPRTLHMTLVGMRDMSIINTPPVDRHPVQTYVVEYHQKLIRDAIARELARGGQVYYVHNRVFSIYDVAAELQAILPEARIAVAHGQMNEGELAKVMLDFVKGGADVLLCTTIIESGLDIPNVNTLIVDQADMFGLSQLYQLRGRVGRSQRQAFAYFTYRKNKVISDIAKKRLIAIRDFTELGAGFKIAMRDLELRGAGNILGPEQHGHIMAVGFDLYCKLLQEEIAAASGKPAEQQPIATILELQLDAYIPDSYIDSSALKVEIYKRISAAESLEAVEQLTEELTDRYGDAPPQLVNLLLLGKLKVPARKLAILSMIQKADFIEVKFSEDHPMRGEYLLEILEKWPKILTFSEKKGFAMRLNTTGVPEQLDRVRVLLKVLTDLMNKLQ